MKKHLLIKLGFVFLLLFCIGGATIYFSQNKGSNQKPQNTLKNSENPTKKKIKILLSLIFLKKRR